jgi:hypothetical protein
MVLILFALAMIALVVAVINSAPRRAHAKPEHERAHARPAALAHETLEEHEPPEELGEALSAPEPAARESAVFPARAQPIEVGGEREPVNPETALLDEVQEARRSGDLDRMLRAVSLDTGLLERHLLLQSIVQEAYRHRA